MDGASNQTPELPSGVTLSRPREGVARFEIRRKVRSRQLGRIYRRLVLALIPAVVLILIAALAPRPAVLGGNRELQVWFTALLLGPAGILIFSGLLGPLMFAMLAAMPAYAEVDDEGVWLAEANQWFRVPFAKLRGLAMEWNGREKHRADASRIAGELVEPAETADASLLVRVDNGWIKTLTYQSLPALETVVAAIRERTNMPELGRAELMDVSPFAEAGQASRGGFWINLSLSLLSVGFITWFYLTSARPALAAEQWPETQATVLESKYEIIKSGSDRRVEVDFQYEYAIDGQTYKGEGVGMLIEHSDARVRPLVEEHPAGAMVSIRYDPDRPDQSSVLVGGSSRLLIVGAASMGVAMLFGVFIVLCLRPDPMRLALHREYRDREKERLEAKAAEARRRERRYRPHAFAPEHSS